MALWRDNIESGEVLYEVRAATGGLELALGDLHGGRHHVGQPHRAEPLQHLDPRGRHRRHDCAQEAIAGDDVGQGLFLWDSRASSGG